MKMDPFSFLSQEDQDEPLSWAWALSPPPPPPPPTSSFRQYKRPESWLFPASRDPSSSASVRNTQWKVIEYLRKILVPQLGGSEVNKASRGFRHIMTERLRREKMSQGYAELLSVLPRMSKVSKISIVQSAVAYLKEMKGAVEGLLERNRELNAMATTREGQMAKVTNIRIHVPDPSHAMDSMIESMRCLQLMGVKARAIRADLHARDSFAVVLSYTL